MRRKLLWLLLYAAWFALSSIDGMKYFERLRGHTNADWVLVSTLFGAGLLLPTAFLWQARRRHGGPFPRASFLRGFKGLWWTDPAQWLRASTLSLAGPVAGAFLSPVHLTGQPLMVFYAYLAFLVGLLIGDGVSRILFRGSIA